MKNLTFTIICLSLIVYFLIRPREAKIEVKEKPVKVYEDELVKNLDELYTNIINPIRKNLGEIYIVDLFRCDKNSQHFTHEAVDIDNDVLSGVSNRAVYDYIRNHLVFDQLILYDSYARPTHLHVSYRRGDNRGEILFGYKSRGRIYYKKIN